MACKIGGDDGRNGRHKQHRPNHFFTGAEAVEQTRQHKRQAISPGLKKYSQKIERERQTARHVSTNGHFTADTLPGQRHLQTLSKQTRIKYSGGDWNFNERGAIYRNGFGNGRCIWFVHLGRPDRVRLVCAFGDLCLGAFSDQDFRPTLFALTSLQIVQIRSRWP